MKSSLSARLALSYLALILTGMVIAASLAWLSVEQLYVDTQKANLLAQAELVASALQGEPPPTAQAGGYFQTDNVLPGIHTRIIEEEGAVVIDMQTPAGETTQAILPLPKLAQNAAGTVPPEELLARPEIAQALAGQPATAVRRVDVAGGRRVLYAAAPVFASDGSVSRIVYVASPLPETSLATLPAATRWQLAGAMLAAAALSSAAGWLLARRIAHPLGKLVHAANAVASGSLDQSVPEDPAIAELSVLGRAFNAMTASLRQSDQAKTAFVADVSHELRAPLTVIKGTIETLQDGALDDIEGRGSFLEAMNRETDRLIRLVNDLLVLTRADAGALSLQLRRVDLGELARARCEYFARAAGQRQVRLLVETQPAPAAALADPDRIAQVLDNLLDNAIRHSPAGGAVTVTLCREAREIRCAVTDAGPGIPPQHLPLIFERFYRVDSSRSRESGGSGLGLSIARALVMAHRGRIAADSREGRGTTVTFWLPVADD